MLFSLNFFWVIPKKYKIRQGYCKQVYKQTNKHRGFSASCGGGGFFGGGGTSVNIPFTEDLLYKYFDTETELETYVESSNYGRGWSVTANGTTSNGLQKKKKHFFILFYFCFSRDIFCVYSLFCAYKISFLFYFYFLFFFWFLFFVLQKVEQDLLDLR